MTCKANYTFKTTPGTVQKFEVECFYVNQNTKILESISASSKSTPRHLKKPFGFIDTVAVIDADTLEIMNKDGERIQLFADRLSPLIDRDDSLMKKTLICVANRGCNAIVGALSEVISKFKTIQREAECGHGSISTARTETDESSQALTSCSLLDETSKKSPGFQIEPLRGLSQRKTATNSEMDLQSVLSQQVEDKMSKTFSVKLTKHSEMYKTKAPEETDQVDKSQDGKGLG